MYIYYPHRLDLPTTQQQQQQPIPTVARQQRAVHSQTDRGLAGEALAFLVMSMVRDAAQCRAAL